MAPQDASVLQKRQSYRYCNDYGYYYDGRDGCYYSAWNAYGRWILLAAIIIGAFLIFLFFSCLTAKRRRRMGQQPYPLTGWAYRPPPGHGPAQYTGQQQYGGQPQYGNQQPYQGGGPPAYGANASYYGGPTGQESGIAHPNSSYQPPRGGEPVYNPPAGAPPGKN